MNSKIPKWFMPIPKKRPYCIVRFDNWGYMDVLFWRFSNEESAKKKVKDIIKQGDWYEVFKIDQKLRERYWYQIDD